MAQTTKSRKSTAKQTSGSNGAGPAGGGGVLETVRDVISNNPAAGRLASELQEFTRNRAQGLVESLGDRIGDAAERLEDYASNGAVKKAAKSVSEGDSPLKAGAKAVGTGIKDKLAGMFGGESGSDGVKATSIAESIELGVPASVAYNQWTQFEEFGRFTKGVQKVDQEDDTTTNWTAKIAFSTRSWKATITEQVPDERIAWTAEGDKGSVDGVVTFHELAPNLTKVLLELEYHPKGVFERTGNLWRAQGRRARLDLKNFRRFVMMRGEETGAWRGEIEDSEVVRRRGDRDGRERRGRERRGRERAGGRRQRPRRDDGGERSQSRRDRDRDAGHDRDVHRQSRRERPAESGSAERSASDPRGASRSGARNRGEGRSRRRPRSAAIAQRRRKADTDSGGAGGGSESSTPTRSAATRSSGKRTSPPRKRSSARKGASTRKGSSARKASATKKTAAANSSSRSRKRTSATKTSAAKKSSPRRNTSAAKKSSPAKKTSPARKTSAAKKSTTKKSAPPRKRSAAKKSSARKSSSRKRATPRKRSGSSS